MVYRLAFAPNRNKLVQLVDCFIAKVCVVYVDSNSFNCDIYQSEMSVTDMCRLCLTKDNLVWVFDKRFENTDSMKYVIFITTGVEISTKDAVSQNICGKCCHIILNMFEFRKKSLENDKQLKEIQKRLQGEDNIIPLPTTVQVKEEKMEIPIETENVHKSSILIHPTVKELYDRYPHIKVQRMCLTSDIKPFVIMPMNEVENYYNEHKLDFKEHCRLALKPRTTARKRTLPSSRASYYSPPCPINGQIIHPEVEDTEEGVLRPIKIKIIPKVSATENTAEEATDILNITETNSYVQEIKKTALCHKKRKYSNTMESLTKENEQLELLHSLNSLEGSNSLSYVANVSMPLYTCNICDAVQNNPKDFKKHRHKHLRCQFCRSTFRSLESKAQHLEDECLTKKAINNFPCLKLTKIETNIDVVKKFPKAFADFHPAVLNNSECYEILSSESETERIESSKPVEHVSPKSTEDVIEILSDDDATINNNGINLQNGHPPIKVARLTPKIKPDVKIEHDPFTEMVSSNSNETIMLKHLLNFSKSSYMEDKGIQTDPPDLPDPNSIEIDESGQTAVFANLKQHLQVFQVPIVIKRGPFSVSYSRMGKRKSKNLQLWNDLIPVDIEKNNTKATAILQSLSTVERVPISTPTPVSRSIGESVNVDVTLISKDSTITTCSKTVYDENCNVSSAEMTTAVSVARPVSSTHSHISVACASRTSALPSRSAPQTTCTKIVVDSPANKSTISEERTWSVIQTNPPSDSASAIRSHSSLHNIPRPKSTESRTYSVSEKALLAGNHSTVISKDKVDTFLVNPPVTSTSLSLASCLIPPNTSVNNIPNVVRPPLPTSAASRKPLEFAVPQLYKEKYQLISNSSNTFSDTRDNNFYKQPETASAGDFIYSGAVTRDYQTQSNFVVNNRKTSSICTDVMQQSIDTSLNKPKENVCSTTPKSSHLPLNVSNSVGTFWPPSTLTVAASNVPIMASFDKSNNSVVDSRYFSSNISQPIPISHSTGVNGSSVSYVTAQSKNIKLIPVRKKINFSNSLPIQTFKPPPPYSVAVSSLSNNINPTLPHQPINKTSDRGNLFTNSVNVSTLPQYSSNSATLPVNNNSCISDIAAVSCISTYQTSTHSTIVAQVNPTSSSVTTPQFGHIRVKNMQELI